MYDFIMHYRDKLTTRHELSLNRSFGILKAEDLLSLNMSANKLEKELICPCSAPYLSGHMIY